MLTDPIGKGGLGTVFEHPDDKKLAAKVIKQKYLQERPEHMDRVRHLIANPIHSSFKGYQFLLPLELVFDEDENPIGFVMPRAKSKCRDLSHLRTRSVPRQFKNRVCLNWSRSILDLHRAQGVRGDIYYSNDLFDEKGKTFSVDMDSIQIAGFPCGVGRPDVCPPELLGKEFKDVIAKKSHDSWIFAIIVFRLLSGVDAFNPSCVRTGMRPSFEDRVKGGFWQYTSHPEYKPRKDIEPLPPCLEELFYRTFDKSAGHSKPKQRPKMKDWVAAFESLDSGTKFTKPKAKPSTTAKRKVYPWKLPVAAAMSASVLTAAGFSLWPASSPKLSPNPPVAASVAEPFYQLPPLRRRAKPRPDPIYLESTFSFSDLPLTPRSESDTPALVEFLRVQ